MIVADTPGADQAGLVTVTAEPLPTRLASIARGTGEVDAVFLVTVRGVGTANCRQP